MIQLQSCNHLQEFSVNFASRVKNPVDKDKTRDL